MKYILAIILTICPLVVEANTTVYPFRASQYMIDGYVRLVYDVTEGGKVRSVKVIESSPEYIFERSVKRQIESWVFEPRNPRQKIPITVRFTSRR